MSSSQDTGQEVKDEQMLDERSSPKNPTVKNIFQLNLDNRPKFKLLVKSYYYQMTKGCLLGNQCKNKYCNSNPSIKSQQPNQIAKMCVDLAQKAFLQEPEYFFCEVINPYIPMRTESGSIALQLQALQFYIEWAKLDITPLTELINTVFSSSDSLNDSFQSSAMLLNKVDFSQDSGVDYDQVRAAYAAIEGLKNDKVNKTLITALEKLVQSFARNSKKISQPKQMRQIIILLECPLFMDPPHHGLLATLQKSILELSHASQKVLKIWLSKVPNDDFVKFINLFQQYITVQLYSVGYIDEKIAYATRVLSILNQSNEMKTTKVPYTSFYNDAVNNIVDLKHDYIRWMRGKRERLQGFANFSFCNYPFILDPGSKSKILTYDAQEQQAQKFKQAFFRYAFFSEPTNLFCVLRVKRDNLLETALNEIVNNQEDLKKPLRVQFIGEQGVDEGGVKKEFFQLIVRQIFDVNIGMFTYNPDTRTFWFNPYSLENDNGFRLIGTVIGLAIYNSVILDVHFPMVVYKKLLGITPELEDLKDLDPALMKGLQQLLDYKGDVEKDICRTFEVEDEAFGKIVRTELKPGGSKIPVTNENRKEYVDLYVKWKLIDSIKRQFDAFKKGFDSVCTTEALKLFRYEELELLVCGSPELDFDALERNTKYVAGYTKDSRIIKDFWEIVKEFSLEEKKKLLAFCTGSDRVPVKGLGSMLFVILKNGPDSDRLPTSHTCFNHLLLPEYKTKEKLKRMLLKAINNYEGFGLM